MRKAFVLIGVPASGKSTWILNKIQEAKANREPFEYEVHGTDVIIDNLAKEQGKTYNDIFKTVIEAATNMFWRGLEFRASLGVDIIVDRTNMSIKSRSRVMQILRKNQYEITAVVFPVPEAEEWQRRLNSREGKWIPPHVLNSMKNSYEDPTHIEGFRVITKEN